MRLDVESLRAFRVVVDTGSFTEAATQLSLTQSAVSWKMKRLEDRLGSALFRREGRQLLLTEFGAELLHHAEQIVAAHDEAVDNLTRSQLEGTVHLGTNDELEAGDIAAVAARFRRRHPLVRLHLTMGTSVKVAKQLAQGTVDVAVLQTLEPQRSDRVLWTEELFWVVAPALKDHAYEVVPLITFGNECIYRPLMERALNSADIDHFVAFEAESSGAVRGAIAAELGVAVLSERSAADDFRRWSTSGLSTDLPIASYVVRVNSRRRSAAVRALVDEVVNALT